MHDFGYVALNMKYVNPEDSGTYTCRATNELGEAVTSATLFVQCKYAHSYAQYVIHFAHISMCYLFCTHFNMQFILHTLLTHFTGIY